jgi:lysyl-tRNA synthetase class 1
MHWSEVVANALAAKGDKHIIASGITPSGEFHIGHLREILTGDMIARACKAKGLDVEFVFVVDSADPLRKVYSFLSSAYERYIGHPLATIPAPDESGNPSDDGRTYAQHFLEPFLEALEQIDVKPRLIDNYQSYADGKFASRARIACEKAGEIKEIIERVSGRELSPDWFPYNPIGHDGSLDGVVVDGFEWPFVHWTQGGKAGKCDLRKAEGKLPWRVDWPARWGWIGVSCEPFGKDHGTVGGSYSTGREIARLFADQPPHPLTYEWISLKGQGAMSSSAGNTIGPQAALALVPPEILRYLIARSKPNKAIDFDTGMGLVNLADEFERLCSKYLDTVELEGLSRRQRVNVENEIGALEMSQISCKATSSLTFRHLALLCQVKSDEEIIAEYGKDIAERLRRMHHWIDSEHFPEEMRIVIRDSPATGLDTIYLTTLCAALQSCEWEVEAIAAIIPKSIKAAGLNVKTAYFTLYRAILGRDKGPRLAPIMAEVKRESILSLLQA